jgi:hypothetical protein
MFIHSWGCNFCGALQSDKVKAKKHEDECRQKFWAEQEFDEPDEQCEYCKWEGRVDGSGEPCYHCKRHWEMPTKLECCSGLEPRKFFS